MVLIHLVRLPYSPKTSQSSIIYWSFQFARVTTIFSFVTEFHHLLLAKEKIIFSPFEVKNLCEWCHNIQHNDTQRNEFIKPYTKHNGILLLCFCHFSQCQMQWVSLISHYAECRMLSIVCWVSYADYHMLSIICWVSLSWVTYLI